MRRSALDRGLTWTALAGVVLLAASSSGAISSAPPASPPATPTAVSLSGRLAFRTFGEEDGLTSSSVQCLLQDATGFLWIGTDDGLFRHDGRRFLRFGRDEGLPSTRVNVIHETADGRFFVGTRSGLARLRAGVFEPLGEAAGLPEKPIPTQGVASDREGQIFVGTQKGLFVGNGDRFSLVSAAPGEGDDPVTGLFVDPDGALLYARGRRLFRRANAHGQATAIDFGATRGLNSKESIDQVLSDGDRNLYVRTLRTLQVLRRGATAFESCDVGLPAAVESGRLALDDRGRLLVPTQRGLAYRFHTARVAEAWRVIGPDEGLSGGTVLSALVDREGLLWIGLAGGGLARRLGRGEFTSWGQADGLTHDVVWAIAREKTNGVERPRGALWIGTLEGVTRLDTENGEIRRWREADGLAGNIVYALAPDNDGSMWAGSWPGGLTRFGPEPGRIRRYVPGNLEPSQARIVALFRSSRGDLWVGAQSGAYVMRTGTEKLERVIVPGGDEPDSVYAFAEDVHGDVYAAGRYGLQRLTGPNARRYRKKDGLKADFIASIAFHAITGEATRQENAISSFPGGPGTRRLIVGYRDALGADELAIDGDRLAANALPLSFRKVLFLGRDHSGALWVGGSGGLDVFEPGHDRPAHYGKADGLLTEDMDQNAFLAEGADNAEQGGEGRTVWIGTSRGLVRYRKLPGSSTPPAPRVVLTGAWAGERRLLSATGQRAPAGQEQLSRGERNVSLSWAGLTFADPKRVRFRHRLVGLEDTFTETALDEARFPALPSGSYRFEVLAVSATGAVSDAPATFAFRVLPAWWEGTLARSGLVAMLLAVVFGVVKLRTRALEADRRRLETAVAARNRELAKANSGLRAANEELKAAQRQIAELVESSSEALHDIPVWAVSIASDLARTIGAAEIGVFAVEGDEIKRLGESTTRAPTLEELRGGEPRHGAASGMDGRELVVPVFGMTGALFGGLVIVRAETPLDWSPAERQLVQSFAHQLGGALELHKLRAELAEMASQRAALRRQMREKGIELVQICARCGRCYGPTASRCEMDGVSLGEPAAMPLRLLGRYRLKRLLGEGGMGTVYHARDERLDRDVAIKIVRPSQFAEPGIRLRFEKEARAVARIRHEGVIAIHDSGDLEDGSAYLVMEMLEGCDLGHALSRSGPATPRQAAWLLRKVSAALSAAHQAGLVHRDIKPENLFLVDKPDGLAVKILDFGLAKSMKVESGPTQSGIVVGTPSYMSPEQIHGAPLGPESDLYSLATVLFETLTGLRMVQANGLAETFHEVTYKPPPALSVHIPGCPEEVDRTFAEALAKDPNARPTDLSEWAEALARLLENVPADVPGWPATTAAILMGDYYKPRESLPGITATDLAPGPKPPLL